MRKPTEQEINAILKEIFAPTDRDKIIALQAALRVEMKLREEAENSPCPVCNRPRKH